MRKRDTISKILKLKDSKKREMEIEVKDATIRADEEKEKLDSLQKEYEDTMECFNSQQDNQTVDAGNIISFYDFFTRINGKINEQKKVHDQQLLELNLLKNSLIDAHKDKKIFEVLEEKEIKNERKGKEASDQKEADYISLARRSVK